MIFFVAIALLAVATQGKDVPPTFDVKELTAYNYHNRFGIPRAGEIERAEEEMFKNTRIVGGEQAAINQVPYQAGLLIELEGTNGRSVCGATLITKNRLTTAAHCWYDGVNQAWRYTVILGSIYFYHGGTRIQTSDVIVMPDWIPELIQNDGAVIYLPQDVVFSESIKPIKLAHGDDLFAGQIGLASGYGLTATGGGISLDQFLSVVELPVITNAVCNRFFLGTVRENNICVSGSGGKSTCNGDSGGPLVVEQDGEPVLAGITSFGIAFGCHIGFPAVFVRVNAIRHFLDEHIPAN